MILPELFSQTVGRLVETGLEVSEVREFMRIRSLLRFALFSGRYFSAFETES
jgi:hypothetical protein